MACDQCKALFGAKSKTAPHDQLEYISSETGFAGHNFQIEKYRCLVCKTYLIRDMDKKDDGACWEPSM